MSSVNDASCCIADEAAPLEEQPVGSEGELGMRGVEALLRDFEGQAAADEPASQPPLQSTAAPGPAQNAMEAAHLDIPARQLTRVGLLEDRLGLPASEPAESSNLLSQPGRNEPEGAQSPPAAAATAGDDFGGPEDASEVAADGDDAIEGPPGSQTPAEQPAAEGPQEKAEVLSPQRRQSARHSGAGTTGEEPLAAAKPSRCGPTTTR